MPATSVMPPEPKRAIEEALRTAGYSHIQAEYSFSLEFSASPESAPVPLAAFWQKPYDQFTSAVAVRWLSDGQLPDAYLDAIARGLWAPYAIIATRGGCTLWETLPAEPTHGDRRSSLLEADLPYPALSRVLAERKQQLGPEAVAARKSRWRQRALYEISPEPSTFFEWAYKPTRARLSAVFDHLVAAARELVGAGGQLDAAYLRWLLRLLAVRIAWDKGWIAAEDRSSGEDILRAAHQYPTPVSLPVQPPAASLDKLAWLLAGQLGQVHLGAADGGVLSQVLQQGGLPPSLRRRWKLFPTPADVAWRMVEALPIEAIAEKERRVWDGTCGTGTLLVAALDRLRPLIRDPLSHDARHHLIRAISGNDLEPALADVTRIVLDLALGEAAGPAWKITVGDVRQIEAPPAGEKPSIFIGNPPFRAAGHTRELAISVVEHYLGQLPDGGLLAVIVPRTMLATHMARGLRQRLLAELEVFEVWELPTRAFPGADTETAVLVARKRYPHTASVGVATWRLFSADRRSERIDGGPQQEWVQSPRSSIDPPLALRLRHQLSALRPLRDYVSRQRRTQGITPGREALAHGDILDQPERGAERYIGGRTGVLPFYLPWRQHPQWIRYQSRRLVWPRRAKEQLFRSPKVLVTRHTTWGHAWRMRAAVDYHGIFPSNQFNALAPEPPLSLEFVAALFNSALANCWLRLVNPAFTARLEELLTIPVPRDFDSQLIEQLESVARRLASVRTRLAGDEGPVSLKESEALIKQAKGLTLTLDAAVYDLYEASDSLRAGVAELFHWLGHPRPGFNEPLVEPPRVSRPLPEEVFTDQDRERMDELFAERSERPLHDLEEEELRRLVDRWRKAHLLASVNEGQAHHGRAPVELARTLP